MSHLEITDNDLMWWSVKIKLPPKCTAPKKLEAFRLRCVEAVLKQHYSIKSVARENGFDESNLRLWLGFYNAYGPTGLKQCRKQHYDAAFKLKVLTVIDKEALSLRTACVRFNIPHDSVIVRWRKNYELNGPAGLMAKARGRPKKWTPPL